MAQIPDNFKKPFKIAIVGGGIGGISLAIGLLRRGVPCQIYEAAPAFAEIGAGLGLGPNSVRSMKLIDPAIKAAYDKVKTKNLWKEEEETWINFRTGIGEPKMVAKVRTTDEDKTGLSSVHRAHFLDGIVKLVPEGVAHFGKRLADLSTVEAGGLQLTFDDGTKAEADAVVGCDGVKSRVRQLLLAKEDMLQDVTFTGKYAYRGLVPMEKAKEHLGGDLAENCQLYIGPGGHVMTYPIDHGTTVNVLAAKTKEDGKWDDEKWVLPHGKEGLVKDFKGWGPPVQGVVDLLEDPDIWALFDHVPAPSYYKGRVAILGDAAHGSTPHQGAGASQALEDAFILCSLLEDDRIKAVEDISSAFAAYDAVRRPRSQKIVTTSREAGYIYGFESSMGDNTDKIGENLMNRFQWIWDEDMDKQRLQAKALLS